MGKKIYWSVVIILVAISVFLWGYTYILYVESQDDLEYFSVAEYDAAKEEVPIVRDTTYTEPEYTSYDAPYTSGFKSYMDYRTITSEVSPQYELQNEYAYTGNYGIRMVNDRYCIALGSYFTSNIGQYVDLVLENGAIIPCILADQKDDEHTDDTNAITMHNGCVSEFVVDTDSLISDAKTYGDISYCDAAWDARVVEVRVYDENIFYE